MTTETAEKVKRKKTKKTKSPKVISFDEETVSKDAATEILSKIGTKVEDLSLNEKGFESQKPKKKRKKRKLEKQEGEEAILIQSNEVLQDPEVAEEVPKPKKKRQKVEASEPAESGKKPESIRAQKRLKYAKLLEEKKLKTELGLQEKALNYLSKWKHSRSEWKFEKLRQIWLQHNMYDDVKIPQEFWEVLVEYFGNCRGKVRDVIVKDAVKIIEEENAENTGKVERAREIVQNLQE